MNNLLRKIAIIIGVFLLGVSIFWSQDGFNFDLAGDSGGTDVAIFIGWGLALSVSVVQFVFSTNYRDLNASLITFGILAYVYSIYTNYQGIVHFQGESANKVGAIILGFVMDGVPEPLIAWGLRESLAGDFIGNVIKAAFGDSGKTNSNQPNHTRPMQNQKSKYQPKHRPSFPSVFSGTEEKPGVMPGSHPVSRPKNQQRPQPKQNDDFFRMG